MIYLTRYVLYNEANDRYLQSTYNLDQLEYDWGNLDNAELFDTPKFWLSDNPLNIWIKLILSSDYAEEVRL